MGDTAPDTQPLRTQSQQATLSSKRTSRSAPTRDGAARHYGSHRRGWAVSALRRVRAARATSSQIEVLLAALEAQPFLVTRRFTSPHGKANYDFAWTKVAADLNNTLNGAVKTPDQWLTVWRDLKSRTCIKAAKIKKEKIKTGNRQITTPTLSVVERRIVSVVEVAMGMKSPDSLPEEDVGVALNTNCPDSMPEEDEVQCDLESGIQIEYVNVNSDEVRIDELENIQILVAKPEIEDSGSELETNAPTTTTEHQERPKTNRNLNPQPVAEQHNSAKSDFLAVAQSNAESMQMIASAAKQQAEAAKLQAGAAKLQAEATLLFAQALNKIADALLVDKN